MASPVLDIEGITTAKWDEVAKATSITTARSLLGERPDPTPEPFRIGIPQRWERDPLWLSHAIVDLGTANRLARYSTCRVSAFGRFTAHRAEQLAQALIDHAAWLRRNAHQGGRLANFERFPQPVGVAPLDDDEREFLRALVNEVGADVLHGAVESIAAEVDEEAAA